MSPRTVIVIPARYKSSRFPGKPLAPLKGAKGTVRSLIERAHAAAMAVPGIDQVLVATDEDRIADHVRGFGGAVAMTAESCRNGTERCAEVLNQLDPAPEVVVNLQGDAPLTPASFVTALVAALEADPQADVATPVLRCDPQTLANFQEDRRAGRVGGTTAVFRADGAALYFSKEVIPYADQLDAAAGPLPVFHHVGVYAYRPRALRAYAGWTPGRLEEIEGLEQLRFLENGASVACVEVEAKGRVFWELNNPVDTARIEAALAAMGVD